MSTAPITDDLVERVASRVVENALPALVARLKPPASVVVAPSDRVVFFAVSVGVNGDTVVARDVDRVRVRVTNQDAATSVFLHSRGQPDPTSWGVELVAGASVLLETRDGFFATSAAGTVVLGVTSESVLPR